MSSFAGAAAAGAIGHLIAGEKRKVKIDLKIDGFDVASLELDAAVSESHSIKARSTRHPVEAGSDIVDNVRMEPLEVTITGVVTNTVAAMFGFLEGGERAEAAFETLRDMIETREPVTILTTLRKYENMIIEELAIPRDANKSNMIEVTIRAVQVTIVESGTVAADTKPKEKRGVGTTATGTAGSVPVPSSPASFSFNALFGG